MKALALHPYPRIRGEYNVGDILRLDKVLSRHGIDLFLVLFRATLGLIG